MVEFLLYQGKDREQYSGCAIAHQAQALDDGNLSAAAQMRCPVGDIE